MHQTNDKNSHVALIGSGLVGLALAKRLIAAGYRVTGFDPSSVRMQMLATAGGYTTNSLIELAKNHERIILSLPDGEIVAKAISEMKPGLTAKSLILDTTTSAPEQVLAVHHSLAQSDIGYMDATISGSSAQVEDGTATWLVGAQQHDFNSASDLFESFGGTIFLLGPPGSGSRMKLVSNLILGLNRAVLAEGLALAEAWQMNLPLTLEVLKSTAAYSRVMDTKGRKMIEQDYIPQARLQQHHKDVRLILDASNETGLDLVLTRLHDQLLQSAEQAGLGELDNSVIFELWRQKNHRPT